MPQYKNKTYYGIFYLDLKNTNQYLPKGKYIK